MIETWLRLDRLTRHCSRRQKAAQLGVKGSWGSTGHHCPVRRVEVGLPNGETAADRVCRRALPCHLGRPAGGYPHGVEIQFYLYLIVYLLLLSLKQQCALQDQSRDNTTATDEQTRKCIQIDTTQPRTPPACGIVTLLGERLHGFWKIGLHWLTRVRNALLMTLDGYTREILAGP
jgi:hypothetical protein